MVRIKTVPKRLWVIFCLLVAISGCASLGPLEQPTIRPIKPAALPGGNGWWYARFRMQWPADTDAIWYPDLFIAHQVILPVLDKHKSDIILWRFHRRAARDTGGRQFSFIFYSSPQTAQQIFEEIQTDSNIVKLKFAGIIEQDLYDDPAIITRPNVEDTSDPNWPVAIQKTWPWYIMGVSRMWLNLISEIVAQNLQKEPPSTAEPIDVFYRQVDDEIGALWQNNGRHAFLHHLNAIFEYESLIYWEKRYLNF